MNMNRPNLLFDLPEEVVGDIKRVSSKISFERFAKTMTDNAGSVSQDLTKTVMHVHREKFKRTQRPDRHKNKRLSYYQRKLLGLYSIRPNSLSYKNMLKIHELWKQYMRDLLKIDNLRETGWQNSPLDPQFESFNIKLYRAEYHGAILKVTSSVCKDLIGISGILAMETKNCFKLVGEDNKCRTIPKMVCDFEFALDELKFSFSGKNFISRPAERSNKKIKLVRPPNFQGS